MKRMKFFGIGATVLLLILSIAPMAQSEDYTADAYDMRDEILSIFESHTDDLAIKSEKSISNEAKPLVRLEYREKTIDPIEFFEPPSDTEDLLGWALAKEFPDPWPWPNGHATKSHTQCVANIDLETGVGEVYAYPYVTHDSWAQVSVECQENNSAWRWLVDDTNGKIVLKSPSYADIEGLPGAHSKITILIKEYEPDWTYSRSWSEDVLLVVGNWEDSLEGFYLDFELLNNYLYKIEVFAYCYQGTASYAHFDPIELKKLWWLYEVDENYEIEITRPLEGKLYFFTHEFPHTFPWPLAIMIFCPGIYTIAYDRGTGVDSVTFRCGDKSCVDDTSDNGYFSCTITRVSSGIHRLYADAYDSNDNLVVQDSIKVLKHGVS